MSPDLSVIGIVFAIILFIVFFSAVILYLAFRIKETFREEKKRGMLAVKVAFLIGILFLAGGSFYFFAQVLSPQSSLPDTTAPDTVPSDNSSSNTTLPETPPPSNETETENGKPELALSVSFPSRTKTSTVIIITFTITNPTEYTVHNVIIQTNEILQKFSLVSSTHEIVGNAIEIGDVLETTICSLELSTPGRPGQISDSVTLSFKEMNTPLTKEISISVTGGQQ
jgi:amino acid transporter